MLPKIKELVIFTFIEHSDLVVIAIAIANILVQSDIRLW